MVRVCGKGQLDVRFNVGQCVLREWIAGGDGLYGYFWEQGRHWASKSFLKDFAEDALTISAGSLFHNGPDWMLKACWRRRVQHLCLRNL